MNYQSVNQFNPKACSLTLLLQQYPLRLCLNDHGLCIVCTVIVLVAPTRSVLTRFVTRFWVEKAL